MTCILLYFDVPTHKNIQDFLLLANYNTKLIQMVFKCVTIALSRYDMDGHEIGTLFISNRVAQPPSKHPHFKINVGQHY